MLNRLRLAALIPVLLFGGPALAADEAAAPVARATSADDQIAAYLNDLPPVSDSGGPAMYGDYVPFDDRRPHGEAGVAIGNHGYRSLYARQTTPIGKTGTLDIALDHSRMNAPWGGRASSTSLAVALDFTRRDGDLCAAEEPWRRETLRPECRERGAPP